MGNVLVTGGAGYIGSNSAKALAESGSTPVTLDNLQSGTEEFVRWGPLVVADILDRAALDAAFQAYRPEAVLHFAGRIDATESLAHPDLYHRTNVDGTRTLLEAMQAHGVTNLVYSSSASVYGAAHRAPIPEDAPFDPVTPYGKSKCDAEVVIRELGEAFGLRSVSLRYFNAAGASAQGEIGEAHDPETHIIPLAIAAAVNNTPFRIFGTDYDTPDGTAVRDYLHVEDLADAHVRAVEYLNGGGSSAAFNLGTCQGASVRDVPSAIELVAGEPVPVVEAPRRPGDPPHLVAHCSRAHAQLGWRARQSCLAEIVSSAWQWHEHLRQNRTTG